MGANAGLGIVDGNWVDYRFKLENQRGDCFDFPKDSSQPFTALRRRQILFAFVNAPTLFIVPNNATFVAVQKQPPKPKLYSLVVRPEEG
ncbi:MAG: hypothetical protein EORIYHIE_003221 [Candidatus Fervidibacter sp.]